ncbi:site-2 protease family protein [Clostridium ganghwense]|uniref:Peptidase M50 domain-containing protein n=1 Tax=Clostridium ganghwense TaxID=312089 RepID=A0ABT4CVM8_9CLOT|nr:site-2 protease family protein [Clostridium ganghwense]MCY6372493.1 hypothetical protein [Clostridium ganghwense]
MEAVIYILIFILCYLISGIIHELGHIIVGLANGWKFYLLVIGPLGIKADENGKIKFYFEKQIAMWGGVGGTVPKSANVDNIRIWSNVLLGGPLASIVMGVIFLPLGIITNNIVLILLGAMPLGMGIMCALPIPLKTGVGTYSDGGRWSRLHKGGQEANEEIALFKLTENRITGGDFLNIDLKSIESLIKSKEIGIQYYGYYYKFQYYKARGNEEEMKLAIQKMEDIKSKVSSIVVMDCKID